MVIQNCDQTFWTYLDALEAAGCVVLFSAGNEGSSGLRRPGDRATDEYRTCAVAAIDPYSGSYAIADFSSRGPTNCTPSGDSAIKPDISAPGVNTYSSVPGWLFFIQRNIYGIATYQWCSRINCASES